MNFVKVQNILAEVEGFYGDEGSLFGVWCQMPILLVLNTTCISAVPTKQERSDEVGEHLHVIHIGSEATRTGCSIPLEASSAIGRC